MSHTSLNRSEQAEFDQSDMTDNSRGDALLEEHILPFMTKHLKSRLTVFKWVGVILISLACTVPGIVFLSSNNIPDYGIVLGDMNQTVCSYIKQYNLGDLTYLTVCNRNGEVFLDTRRFINGTGTIIGIQLNLRQWLRLKQVFPLIDTAISEARTYWNDMKKLVYNKA